MASGIDVIAVLDGDTQTQVFTGAKALRLSISESSKTMEHPLETEGEIADHRIILPVEAVFSFVIAGQGYQSVYGEIRELFLNATPLTVQTRVRGYDNLIIESIPHDETPEVANGVTMTLKLREVKIVTAVYTDLPPSAVANKSQASTTQKGEVAGEEASAATAQEGTILYGLFR